MDNIHDEDILIITETILAASIMSFDHEAAQSATVEQSRDMLKVLKHYIRAIHGSDAVNSDLKIFLNLCGVDPAYPGSVVGGFNFLLEILQLAHQCSGKDCVRRHILMKKKKDSKKISAKPLVDRDYKKSVKQPGIRVKQASKSSKAKSKTKAKKESASASKKDVPNYFI